MMPHRMGTATVLAIALLLSTVPAGIWTHLAGVARAQDEQADADTALPGQVIAHGIAATARRGGLDRPLHRGARRGGHAGRLLPDRVRHRRRRLDRGAGCGGRGAEHPGGWRGSVPPQRQARSARQLAGRCGASLRSGTRVGSRRHGWRDARTAVGNPFTAPEGKAFDLEIARASLDRDDQTTIPVSRSGAPVLYLQTAGVTQLQAEGGQTAELAAGQFAVLLGEVMARGASDEPATFLVAAIGEATAERDATEGIPEARAEREGRQRARDEAAQSAGGAPGAEQTREKRPKRVRTGGGERGGGGGGQGRQTVPQGTGGTGTALVTGGVDTTAPAGVPAGTPAVEPTVEATLPAETTVPTEGTPPPDATTPAEDEAPPGATETPEPTAPVDDTAPTEDPTTVEPSPTVEAPSVEETLRLRKCRPRNHRSWRSQQRNHRSRRSRSRNRPRRRRIGLYC